MFGQIKVLVLKITIMSFSLVSSSFDSKTKQKIKKKYCWMKNMKIEYELIGVVSK